MPLDALLTALDQHGVVLDERQLTDAIWLHTHAQFLKPATVETSPPDSQTQNPAPDPQNAPQDPDHPLPDQSNPPETEASLQNLPGGSGPNRITGTGIRTPLPPALPNRLAMQRALRPLQRRAPSPSRREIDIHATVDRVAQTKVWQIVERPARERALEVALVVERSPTMRFWHTVAHEFERILVSTSAFRHVQVYQLDAFERDVHLLRANQKSGANSAAELPRMGVCTSGAGDRRLILYLTDCMSRGWLGAEVPKLLADWQTRHPAFVIQVLAQYMWPRSSLRNAWNSLTRIQSVRNRSLRKPRIAGLPVRATDAGDHDEDKDYEKEQRKFLLPLIELHEDALANFANYLIAKPNNAVTASHTWSNAFDELSQFDQPGVELPPPRPVEERFERFWRLASWETRELALYLANAPLFLPVMRLIQANLVPGARPWHLAELFHSGLLETVDDGLDSDEVEYRFNEQARNHLIDEGSAARRRW